MFDQFELVLHELRSMWRFRWQAVATAWLVCLVGWVAVLLIPPVYVTKARVYVDTNSLLRPLLEGLAVPPNTINQVELVRQRLLARPQLEQVVDSTSLRNRYRTPREKEVLLATLAEEIAIEGRGGRTAAGASTFYEIAFRDSNPQTSYTVVKKLLDSFVSQSLGANQSNTETAQRFLEQQLKEYESRLSISEERLAEFKRNNIGAMPDDRGGYFARLQNEMVELDRLKSAYSVAVAKRSELSVKLMGGPAGGGTTEAASVSLETSVDARIATTRAELEALLLRFTEAHPDVRATEENLQQLEAQRQAELKALRENRGALGAPRGTVSLVAQNLQIALNQAELDITSMQGQIADKERRIAELRASITTVPAVEAELARLNRDYNVTRTQYDVLLQRLETARLSGEADQRDDLRMSIVEPPMLPLEPAEPRLLILLAAVLIAGMGAGILMAFARARLHPVYVSMKQLTLTFKLPSLGTIGVIDLPAATAASQRALAHVAWAVFALIGSFGALVALSPSAQALGAALRSTLSRS